MPKAGKTTLHHPIIKKERGKNGNKKMHTKKSQLR